MKVCIRKNRLLVFGESEYFIILCFIYSTAIDFLIYFSNSLSYTSTLHGVVRLQKTVVTQNHFNTKPSYARRPRPLSLKNFKVYEGGYKGHTAFSKK